MGDGGKEAVQELEERWMVEVGGTSRGKDENRMVGEEYTDEDR